MILRKTAADVLRRDFSLQFIHSFFPAFRIFSAIIYSDTYLNLKGKRGFLKGEATLNKLSSKNFKHTGAASFSKVQHGVTQSASFQVLLFHTP